jgi:hypothetical protein
MFGEIHKQNLALPFEMLSIQSWFNLEALPKKSSLLEFVNFSCLEY